MSGQPRRCCSSDRDVPEMQMEYFFAVSDRKSSIGQTRFAETCEITDKSPSFNLSGWKQGKHEEVPRLEQ